MRRLRTGGLTTRGSHNLNFNITLRTAVAALLVSGPACLLAAPADEVKSLAESGRAADAYALGKQHPEALGDPVFDFFFGIAAIDAGQAGDGVLALERYILVFPDNTSARLQLARGYFILGEDSRAREEFEELRKLDPPTDVAATLERYLDAIRLRETRYTTSSGGYVEWGLGTDSNVNSGVSNANISLPNLGPVIVGPGGTKNRDTFNHVGAGGYVTHPILPGVALYANGTAEWKLNGTHKMFDQGSYSASAGVSLLKEKELFRVGLNHGLIYIDNERYRSSTGISGEWQHQIDQHQAFTLGAQTGRLTYAGLNSPRDANFVGLTGGYRKLFNHAWQPILSASVNVGREDAMASGREDLSRHYTGWRLGMSFTPAAKWGVAAGYTAQSSRYQAPDAFLGVARRDDYEAIDAAVTYLINRNLSVRGEALLSKNRSNITLFSFPRDIFVIKLRYEFK
jgi:hypothetical protein